MPMFMDVHNGMKGVTAEQLKKEHAKDTAIEQEEGVKYHKAWADPKTGKAFCLVEGPNIEAVKRIHERAGHPADEIYEVPVVVE